MSVEFTREQTDRINNAADELVRLITETAETKNTTHLAQNVIAQCLAAVARHGSINSGQGMQAAIEGALSSMKETDHIAAMELGMRHIALITMMKAMKLIDPQG